ncbi:MAG: sigma-70 family RNA polymerase sigma factor [Oscillospiraceae bacterium]
MHQPTENTDVDMERIATQYGTQMLRMCFMYLKDMQLAEDAVQDTMLKIYRNYTQFEGNSGEKTWVMRIAINVCKDYLRSAWNRRVNVVEELNDIPDSGNSTHEDDTLIKEIMCLKPKYKEVILLFYYEDMQISEIAKVLNAPASTVAVRLKRGREILKKRLEGWYYDE